jgi:hypothetical protein
MWLSLLPEPGVPQGKSGGRSRASTNGS